MPLGVHLPPAVRVAPYSLFDADSSGACFRGQKLTREELCLPYASTRRVGGQRRVTSVVSPRDNIRIAVLYRRLGGGGRTQQFTQRGESPAGSKSPMILSPAPPRHNITVRGFNPTPHDGTEALSVVITAPMSAPSHLRCTRCTASSTHTHTCVAQAALYHSQTHLRVDGWKSPVLHHRPGLRRRRWACSLKGKMLSGSRRQQLRRVPREAWRPVGEREREIKTMYELLRVTITVLIVARRDLSRRVFPSRSRRVAACVRVCVVCMVQESAVIDPQTTLGKAKRRSYISLRAFPIHIICKIHTFIYITSGHIHTIYRYMYKKCTVYIYIYIV